MVVLISGPSYGQNDSLEQKNSEWREKHFFHSGGFTLISEYSYGKFTEYYRQDHETEEDDSLLFKDAYSSWMFAGVDYFPRVNLVDINEKTSLGVATPVALGLGIDSRDNFFLKSRIGLMVVCNLFYHSTWNNIDNRGGYIGFGPNISTGPLIKSIQDDGPEQFLNTSLVAIAGYKFVKTNSARARGHEVGVMYGPGSTFENPGGNKQRANYFFTWFYNIVFGYD